MFNSYSNRQRNLSITLRMKPKGVYRKKITGWYKKIDQPYNPYIWWLIPIIVALYQPLLTITNHPPSPNDRFTALGLPHSPVPQCRPLRAWRRSSALKAPAARSVGSAWQLVEKTSKLGTFHCWRTNVRWLWYVNIGTTQYHCAYIYIYT